MTLYKIITFKYYEFDKGLTITRECLDTPRTGEMVKVGRKFYKVVRVDWEENGSPTVYLEYAGV